MKKILANAATTLRDTDGIRFSLLISFNVKYDASNTSINSCLPRRLQKVPGISSPCSAVRSLLYLKFNEGQNK